MLTSETLRTFRNASVVGGFMFAALAGYATLNGGITPLRTQADAARHMSRGIDGAGARLHQELIQLNPVGSDAGVLLSRLSREGFECGPDATRPGSYDCVFTRQLTFGRVARLRTRLETDGRYLTAIRPDVRVEAVPVAVAALHGW